MRFNRLWPTPAFEGLKPALLFGEYLSYRVGTYLLLNVVEDPAWLALAFC